MIYCKIKIDELWLGHWYLGGKRRYRRILVARALQIKGDAVDRQKAD